MNSSKAVKRAKAEEEKYEHSEYTYLIIDSILGLTVENSTIEIRGGYAREKPTTDSMDFTEESRTIYIQGGHTGEMR